MKKKFMKVTACLVFLSTSCTSMHTLKGYKLPDTSLANADTTARVEEYEASKVTYGKIPGMFIFGPGIFLQRDLITKEDAAIRAALVSPLHFSPIPIPKDRYPPDRVVAEDLFRQNDAALDKYMTGRRMETGERAGKGVYRAGIGIIGFTGFIFTMDLLLSVLSATSTKDGYGGFEDRMLVYGGLVTAGGVAFVGGTGMRVGFGIARRAAYSDTAEAYNRYLRRLFDLPEEK